MPNFVWSAKDKFGNTVLRELTTHTAEQSRDLLLSEGHTELRLIEDAIISASQETFTETTVFGEKITVTAADRRKFRDQPRVTWLRVLTDSLRQDLPLYLLIGLPAALALHGSHWAMLTLMLGGALVWLGFRFWLAWPGVFYRRLNDAREWHRWPEVLDLLDRLEKVQRLHLIKIPKTERLRIRALALAGSRRLSEALQVFEGARHQTGMPDWLYLSHLSAIYETAKDIDQTLSLARQAAELSGQSTLYLDLAWRLLHRKNETGAARMALAKVDASTLVDFAEPFLIRCQGVLSFLEGDIVAARRDMEKALARWETLKHQVFRKANMAITHGYLCLVTARQGDMAQARHHFAQAQDFLTAAEEDVFLGQCRSFLGQLAGK